MSMTLAPSQSDMTLGRESCKISLIQRVRKFGIHDLCHDVARLMLSAEGAANDQRRFVTRE